MRRFQNIFKKKLSYEKKADFFDFINQMISSAVPIYEMFDVVDSSVIDRDILNVIKNGLENGKSLSKSIESTDAFDDMAISIVNMGEESGSLNQSFEKLRDYYKDMSENKKTFEKALFYPLILLTALVFLISFLNFYFIPTVKNIYSIDVNKLDRIPFIVFEISGFLNHFKFASILVICSILVIITQFASNISNYEKVRIPFISDIIEKRRISNAIWAYYILLSSGIDFINSSMIIMKKTKSQKTRMIIKQMLDMIKEGNSLTKTVKSLDLRDKKLLYFISLAESSGNIEKNLENLYHMYNKDIKNKTDILKTTIEPILVILVTIVTATIILGVIMPIINIIELGL